MEAACFWAESTFYKVTNIKYHQKIHWYVGPDKNQGWYFEHQYLGTDKSVWETKDRAKSPQKYQNDEDDWKIDD